MRRISFLLLFLLVGSLLAAAPVRAATEYYGLSFDGVDDCVRVEDSTSLNITDELTIISIFSVNDPSISQSVAGKGWNWRLWVSGTLRGVFYDSNGSSYIINTGVPLVSRESYFFAISYSTSSAKIKAYVNGELKGTKDTAGLPLRDESGDPFVVGGAAYPGGNLKNPFSGKVYLVLIYSRALSDEEIQAIYNDPLHPPTDGLVLEYLPSSVDTVNGLWKDLSGNGNDGTIDGATYVPLRPVSESTPSQSSPYELYFDGNDYIEVNNFITGNLSGITLVVLANYSEENINKEENRYVFTAWNGVKVHIARTFTTVPTFYVWNGSEAQSIKPNQQEFGTYDGIVMQAFVADTSTQTLSFYKNAQLIESKSVSLNTISFENPTLIIMQDVIGEAYLILFYTRALSNDEIEQIYESPLNPPTDGLILFYSPYSYDPESGKWLNLAPIFPTIPLTEELDGVNYGAEPMRISIIQPEYIDSQTNTPINTSLVSVEATFNNTSFTLLSPLPIVPFNTTVTLNFTATGYKPVNLTTSFQSPSPSLLVYFAKSQTIIANFTEVTNITIPGLNLTTIWNSMNVSPNILDIFTKWVGGEYVKYMLELNVRELIENILNNPPLPGLGIVIASSIWVFGIIMTWVYFEEPEAVFMAGEILYFAITDFMYYDPAMNYVPVAGFILFLGVEWMMKFAKMFGKRW